MVTVKVVRKLRKRYSLTPSFCVVVFLVGANVGLLAFINKFGSTYSTIYTRCVRQSRVRRTHSLAEYARPPHYLNRVRAELRQACDWTCSPSYRRTRVERTHPL
ncbi:hypothetical protein Y032_0001g132 [Ancylostoma ceylanicum]|uniref:Uncharacterized protein n=1 Tax=Ancylostoma ceylanicum TaxID=53326 RepID=A0A016W2N2_9BILA|nr:hypothetical protein Y032_0001g132 [Ancylostoma ceylanicum]